MNNSNFVSMSWYNVHKTRNVYEVNRFNFDFMLTLESKQRKPYINTGTQSSLCHVSVSFPCAVQLYIKTGQIVELLQVKEFLKSVHKAVLWIQTKPHGP